MPLHARSVFLYVTAATTTGTMESLSTTECVHPPTYPTYLSVLYISSIHTSCSLQEGWQVCLSVRQLSHLTMQYIWLHGHNHSLHSLK